MSPVFDIISYGPGAAPGIVTLLPQSHMSVLNRADFHYGDLADETCGSAMKAG